MSPPPASPGSPGPATALPRSRVLAALGVSAVVFGLVDAVWLTVGSGSLYDDRLGHLLADEPNLGAAVAFYVIFLLGLLHFVLVPALRSGSMRTGLRDAAAFGVVTYATFDLTSMAVFRDVPLLVVVVDIVWGALLCTVTTAVTLAVLRRRSR